MARPTPVFGTVEVTGERHGDGPGDGGHPTAQQAGDGEEGEAHGEPGQAQGGAPQHHRDPDDGRAVAAIDQAPSGKGTQGSSAPTK